MEKQQLKKYDLICVGGGIMSTTLALLTQVMNKNIRVAIFERLDDVALESSAAWNNAGTGHSALCELNYTPKDKDGNIDISKAIKVFEQFEVSKQFWAYLIKQGLIKDPSDFIHHVPHHSWVVGDENCRFLEDRFHAMQQHPYFKEMVFTRNHNIMQKWFPLIMQDRLERESLAATRVESGAELNFGALTKKYAQILQSFPNVDFYFNHQVKDIDPTKSVDWLVEVKDRKTKEMKWFDADNVFIGAGGWALPLLQKVEMPEKEGYGGFPVSGQWLICKNKKTIANHHAKVYSKAGTNAPPMSVPHLDTRFINGKQELLFGPFAGFSTKFLKEGSFLDFTSSIQTDNIIPMFGAFWHNLDLTQYLIDQVSQSHEDRVDDLKKFIVEANPDDWELKIAGQRVQVIKKDDEQGGVLQFGTEVVKSKSGNITALLGASPGASVAVDVMLKVLQNAFKERIESENWNKKLTAIFPFYNQKPSDQIAEFLRIREENNKYLGLV